MGRRSGQSSLADGPCEVDRFGPATVAISEGLDVGEVIVIAGVQALHPGQKIRILGSE